MNQILDHADDLFFPVRTVPVYAALRFPGGERFRPVPGKQAIVNCATDEVISVVSSDYHIVTNRDALEYGQQCCRAAFPGAGPREWRVLQAHTSATKGSCQIDLVHPASALDFGGPVVDGDPDAYGPFVRVTNSYNRSRALRFEIGFIRWICSNGMLVPESSIKFSFDHSTPKIAERVAFKVRENSFRELREKFQDFLAPLRECDVPLNRFVPATLAVLRINKPEPMENRLEEPWEKLAAKLEGLSNKYSQQLGPNGYALMNVITDVASRPPRSRFIRRQPHNLQLAAGSWLADFSAQCRESAFDACDFFDQLKEEPDRYTPSGRGYASA